MVNIQLSKNFSLYELIRSSTASRLNIKNVPNNLQINNLTTLVSAILQPARDFINIGIIVTSGFRCNYLNKIIGGSSSSDHCNGNAADLKLVNGDNAMLFNFIKNNLDFDQLIWEYGDDDQPEWVHVSYRNSKKNRKQVLRVIKINGKTKYITI